MNERRELVCCGAAPSFPLCGKSFMARRAGQTPSLLQQQTNFLLAQREKENLVFVEELTAAELPALAPRLFDWFPLHQFISLHSMNWLPPNQTALSFLALFDLNFAAFFSLRLSSLPRSDRPPAHNRESKQTSKEKAAHPSNHLCFVELASQHQTPQRGRCSARQIKLNLLFPFGREKKLSWLICLPRPLHPPFKFNWFIWFRQFPSSINKSYWPWM